MYYTDNAQSYISVSLIHYYTKDMDCYWKSKGVKLMKQ